MPITLTHRAYLNGSVIVQNTWDPWVPPHGSHSPLPPTGHEKAGAMPGLRIWAAWFRNAVFGLRGCLCLWSIWDFKLSQGSGISKMWWISHPQPRSSFSLPRHGGLHYHLIPRRSRAWIAAGGLTVAMICYSASLSQQEGRVGVFPVKALSLDLDLSATLWLLCKCRGQMPLHDYCISL